MASGGSGGGSGGSGGISVVSTLLDQDVEWFRANNYLPGTKLFSSNDDFQPWDFEDTGVAPNATYRGARFYAGQVGITSHFSYALPSLKSRVLFFGRFRPQGNNFGLFMTSNPVNANGEFPNPSYLMGMQLGLPGITSYYYHGPFTQLGSTDPIIYPSGLITAPLYGFAMLFDGGPGEITLFIKTASEQWWIAQRETNGSINKVLGCGIRSDCAVFGATPQAVYYDD